MVHLTYLLDSSSCITQCSAANLAFFSLYFASFQTALAVTRDKCSDFFSGVTGDSDMKAHIVLIVLDM